MLNELLGGTIVESGSNANGSYIKFSNGTMICYNKLNLTNITFAESGNLYACDYTTAIPFPIQFIDTPIVTINTQSSADYYFCWVYATRCNKTSINQITLMRTVQRSNVSVPIGYIAIGRWKA